MKILTKAQKLWLEALESGEYKQAIDRLYDGKGYCCLGVACKIYNKENNKRIKYRQEAGLSKLPIIHGWLGLRTTNGFFGNIDGVHNKSLTGLNDDGKSFAEIAEIVRANPDKVFK